MVLPRARPMMEAMVLASTAALLLASDVPVPVEMTAMGMVGTFLLWLIKREDKAGMRQDSRLAALEAEAKEQRHLKHEVRSRVTVALTALDLAQKQGAKCSCGAMTPVVDVLAAVVDSLNAFLAPPPQNEPPH